jgi:hypothetical protein
MFGSLTVTNSTLSGNIAQGGSTTGSASGGSGYGGAIFNLDGSLNLTFCTVADNTVAAGTANTLGNAAGGAVYNLAFGNNINTGATQTATATLTDSILSNSVGGVDLVNNAVIGANLGANINAATMTLNGPNLVQTISGNTSGTLPLTANPQLGPLANYGGMTPTFAVPASSPAYQVGTPISGITTDQRGLPRSATTPTLGAFEVQTSTTTVTSNPTITFSASTQTVMLTATVSSTETVNGGSVTFAVAGAGPNVQGNVVNGQASATFTVNAGVAAGSYPITAAYTPALGFSGSASSGRSDGTLTVSAASTTTTASNATTTFSTSAQNVTLIATVSSGDGAVNEGTVTFTVLQGSTVLGTATTSGTVRNGVASGSYLLPGGMAAGTYTLDAVYNPGADFTGSDGTALVVVNAAASPPAPSTPSGSAPTPTSGSAPTPTSAGLLGLAFEEFELTLFSFLSLASEAAHLPDASLQTTIASLQTAIHNDPLASTAAGQLANLLSQVAAWNVLGGQ